jgi:excisionase family DNA binding protein
MPEVPDDEWLLTVPEAAAQLRISRSHFFKLKRRGVIETIKLGSRTVVPRREISRLIDEAMEAAYGAETEPAKKTKNPDRSRGVSPHVPTTTVGDKWNYNRS